MENHILTYLVFMPAAIALPLVFVESDRAVRWVSLAATSVVLAMALIIYLKLGFAHVPPGSWLVSEDTPWIGALGIRYSLGLDGISLLMVTLSAFLFVLSVAVSWRAVTERVALFHFMLLMMETGVLGVFLSTDLFLFYLFWEVMLIPMFFLIGLWGHGRRVYSAVKFFIFTVSGSLIMLAAIIGIYLIHASITGVYTFSIDSLAGTRPGGVVGLLLFAAFFLAFAVKVPLFPLHTWLPDAHTDAPTAGSVILAGLLLKTGTYGLVRIGFPLFPQAASVFVPLALGLGVVGLYYASWVAFAQSDMKRLVAYSSIAHLGVVVMGIAAWNELALGGAIIQMVNHGLSTGALFIMVGMMDERMHTREISAYGGLWGRAPALSAFFLLFLLSSSGLPGLNNFVGEFLIFLGLFRDHPAMAVFAFAGIVASLIYLLMLGQKVLFGPAPASGPFADITAREAAVLIPLAVLVIVLGCYPSLILRPLDAPVSDLVGIYGMASLGVSP
jgi:NADH-quinone oxidoreductase subunit M